MVEAPCVPGCYDLVELISLGLRYKPRKGCLQIPSVRYGWSEGMVPQRVSCPLQPLPRSCLTCLWLPSLSLFNCVNLNLTLPRDQRGLGWDPKHRGSLESPQAFCWEGASLELYSEQMVGCARPHCRILSQGLSAPGSRESRGREVSRRCRESQAQASNSPSSRSRAAPGGVGEERAI